MSTLDQSKQCKAAKIKSVPIKTKGVAEALVYCTSCLVQAEKAGYTRVLEDVAKREVKTQEQTGGLTREVKHKSRQEASNLSIM